jgi:CO/xanthine dehydrogenase Mo-binding subunit
MTRKAELAAGLEPERYELHSPLSVIFETDRRDFFKFLGAGIFVACAASKAAAFQESGRRGGGSEDNLPKEIDAWLHIGEKGEITVFTGKVEVGQNIRTSLSQAVAEELHVPMASIQMVMGDTQLVPFDMGTFGSRTTPTMNLQLRRVAAAACDALVAIAARQWSIDPAHLSTANGKVFDPKTNRSASYAELAKGQLITQLVPAEDPLIPARQWKIAGQAVPKVDGIDFVIGKHRYPADYTAPGMLYGKVVRPSSFGATLSSAETSAAERMEDVTVVRDGDFVGVAAPTSALAEKAAASIKTKWKSQLQISHKELFEYLRKNAAPGEERNSGYVNGDVQKAFANCTHRLNSTFNIAYIAHAPLEPRAALAQWNGDQLTVWTGTQRPFGVRGELATAFHLPEEKVRVVMPDTGSGYGGKHTGETALEAARLARAAKKPVKVVWTREEEFTWAYFRPAGVIDVSSAVSSDGKITAWEFHNYNSGAAGIRTYYDIPHQRIQFHSVDSPLRQGSYRALAATANHFAREVHMDEIAKSLKTDPLEFRLKHLKEERLRAVFEQGGKQFGWDKPRPRNHGFGAGGGFEKLGYIATFAEVSVKPATREIKVERVLTAFDCGAIVNPDGLRNQLIGANVMGLGGAIFEAIEFENGRILNNVFSKYRVPRFRDVPATMDALLIDRKDQPSVGAGEAPLLGIAPAIANAIFQVTQIPLHSLPMAPELAQHDYKVV